MRIDKFLANQNIGSRSQVKQYIKKGMISVNGTICKSPEQKIDENTDLISYNGTIIGYQKHHRQAVSAQPMTICTQLFWIC